MNSNQVRTVLVANADLVLVHAALAKLRSGQPLTALESGVVDEPSIANLALVQFLPMFFDGFAYVQPILVTSG